MATTDDLQRRIDALVRLAQRDVRSVFGRASSFAEAEEALNDLLGDLIDAYGSSAAAVAAEWYDELREQFDVPGRFSAIVPEPSDPGVSALTGWARGQAHDLTTMQSLVLGGMQRRIANVSRETVMESTYADPRAEGWMRVGRGHSCPFCSMLISRGAVYGEKGVKFGSHDHCNCGAAPSWGNPSDVFDVDEYRRSLRSRSDETRDTDNARAREWIADNL